MKRNPPKNSVPDLSDVPLDGFEVADGVDWEDDETAVEIEDEEEEEEVLVQGTTEGNESVGEEDARLQNCWSSFSSVIRSW